MAKHRYDRDPTPEQPVVRLYPAIPWLNNPAYWVRDDGQDTMDQDIIAAVGRPHRYAS